VRGARFSGPVNKLAIPIWNIKLCEFNGLRTKEQAQSHEGKREAIIRPK